MGSRGASSRVAGTPGPSADQAEANPSGLRVADIDFPELDSSRYSFSASPTKTNDVVNLAVQLTSEEPVIIGVVIHYGYPPAQDVLFPNTDAVPAIGKPAGTSISVENKLKPGIVWY